jgi:uncharacterized protein
VLSDTGENIYKRWVRDGQLSKTALPSAPQKILDRPLWPFLYQALCIKVFLSNFMYQNLPRSIRLWGMGCHLSAIVCPLCNCVMIPFVSLIVPYLVWVSGRDRHPFVDDQGRKALNFQISMAIYTISGGILLIFLFLLTCGMALTASTFSSAMGNIAMWFGFALATLIALFALFQLGVIILAAIKAYNGQSYQYPFTLRFLQ